MGPTIGEILPFAVAIAIFPVPIISIILILLTPEAKTNGPAFAAGWVLTLLVIASVTMLAADGLDVSTDESSSDLAFLVKFLFGVALFGLAFKQWRERPASDAEPEMPSWM